MQIEELVMNLFLAVKDNDLDMTKKLVDSLNEQYDSIDPELNIWLLLDVHNPELYDAENKAIEYVLLNLKGLINPEVARWNRKKYQLSNFNNNVISIENFINEQLDNKTYDIDDSLFIQGLIELTVKINDNKKTRKIFNRIKKLKRED